MNARVGAGMGERRTAQYTVGARQPGRPGKAVSSGSINGRTLPVYSCIKKQSTSPVRIASSRGGWALPTCRRRHAHTPRVAAVQARVDGLPEPWTAAPESRRDLQGTFQHQLQLEFGRSSEKFQANNHMAVSDGAAAASCYAARTLDRHLEQFYPNYLARPRC